MLWGNMDDRRVTLFGKSVGLRGVTVRKGQREVRSTTTTNTEIFLCKLVGVRFLIVVHNELR